MALQPAANAISSWEVVEAFENRLKAGVVALGGKPTAGFVRISAAPDDREGGAYKAEEGIHVVPGDAQPFTSHGSARYGSRTRRVFEVTIVTVSNQDRAGEARIASKKHMNVEDMVFDVLMGTPPYADATAWNTKVGITCKWIPGGDAIKRAKTKDPGKYVSVHLFEVIYTQKTSIPA